MNKLKKLKENKVFNIIMKVLKAFVIILLIGFVIVVCLQRFSVNRISFFNYRMFTVISGSMRPKYDIGDVLVAKEVDPATIKVGDSISYLGTKGDFKNKVITHEVVGIEKDQSGEIVFRAKGLANIIEDPKVMASQLYGKVIYKSIILSIIYRIVANTIGFYLFIIIPMMYIIGSEIIRVLLEKEAKRRAHLKGDS